VDGLHVCTGHGPWGISLGPETARLAARAILDGAAVPPAYAAGRVGDR
jgi:glycine/D-amino acid oxidase-like deaminating enzyme